MSPSGLAVLRDKFVSCLWLFFMCYIDTVMKEVKMKMGRMVVRFMLEGRERRLLRARRMNKVPNAWVRVLCGVTKVVNKGIDECVLRWFGYLERMEKDRVYVGECAGSCQWVVRERDGLMPLKDYLR